MFDVFIKLKPSEFKNQKINYYMMLIYSEIKNMLIQNAIKYNDFKNSCCGQFNDSNEKAGLILESKLCFGCKENIEILFTPGDPNSKRLAQIFADNLKNIFENPRGKIKTLPQSNNNLSSVPTVAIRFNFSCNNNFDWVLKNTENIPAAIVMSLTEFFGIPFTAYPNKKMGISKTDAAVFKRPNKNSKIIQTLEPSEKIEVISQWEDWYIIKKNNSSGFVHSKFINI